MCPPGYYQSANDWLLAWLVEHSLVHWCRQCLTVHHVPKCMSYHGVIGGLAITGRAHCLSFWLHIYIPANIDVLTRLQDVIKRWRRLMPKQDVATTSGKRCRICEVLKTSDLRCLQDVWFTASWRCMVYVVLKTSNLRRLEDVWFMTSWRRLIYDVLKTSVKQHLCSDV